MRKPVFLLGVLVLAVASSACGPDDPAEVTRKRLAKEEEAGRQDPYRSPMADRINAVLYPGSKPAKMLEGLALLGVAPGKGFEDFKEQTKIDDWFTDGPGGAPFRYTSLTCGLSPVVDDGGKIQSFYRSRKYVDGKTHPEMFIGPGKE